MKSKKEKWETECENLKSGKALPTNLLNRPVASVHETELSRSTSLVAEVYAAPKKTFLIAQTSNNKHDWTRRKISECFIAQ